MSGSSPNYGGGGGGAPSGPAGGDLAGTYPDPTVPGKADLDASNLGAGNVSDWLTNLGLSNVDNTSDANKPVSTAQQTALNLKANIASPTLTGVPAAPTAAPGTNTTQLANTAFVNAALAGKADLDASNLTAPDKTAWQAALGVGGGGAATWVTATVYAVGTLVGSAGATWRCKAATTVGDVTAPESDSTHWEPTRGAANASGGYPGLSVFKLQLKNNAGTFTNTLENTTTAARAWVMPDKAGTVAMTSDLLTGYTADYVARFGVSATGNCTFGWNSAGTGSYATVMTYSGSAAAYASNFGGASAAAYGTVIGALSYAGSSGLTLGRGVVNTIAGRTEIGSLDGINAISARISMQYTNKAMQHTLPKSDTAPTDSTMVYNNADGTLPRGMLQAQVNAAGTSLLFYYNDAGTIKTATVALV